MNESKKINEINILRDEWAHPNALHEWWYINSHVITSDGRELGLFLAFFPDYLIFSLSDKKDKKLISKRLTKNQRLVTSEKGICFGKNSLEKIDNKIAYKACYYSDRLSFELTLVSQKQPLMVNGNGKIKEGLLGTSWYYALTNLSATGHLKLASETLQVKGVAWIDRQWGSWEDMGIGSWIWFSLQLSNGCEILATEIYTPFLRRSSSKVLSIKMQDSREFHTSDFGIHETARWKSETSGSVYGARWIISSENMLNLRVATDFDEQELQRGLWEGSCEVEGTFEGNQVHGIGFAEQVERSASNLLSLLSLSVAPYHYIIQNLLDKPNLGVWDLVERLGVWKALPARSRDR